MADSAAAAAVVRRPSPEPPPRHRSLPPQPPQPPHQPQPPPQRQLPLSQVTTNVAIGVGALALLLIAVAMAVYAQLALHAVCAWTSQRSVMCQWFGVCGRSIWLCASVEAVDDVTMQVASLQDMLRLIEAASRNVDGVTRKLTDAFGVYELNLERPEIAQGAAEARRLRNDIRVLDTDTRAEGRALQTTLFGVADGLRGLRWQADRLDAASATTAAVADSAAVSGVVERRHTVARLTHDTLRRSIADVDTRKDALSRLLHRWNDVEARLRHQQATLAQLVYTLGTRDILALDKHSGPEVSWGSILASAAVAAVTDGVVLAVAAKFAVLGPVVWAPLAATTVAGVGYHAWRHLNAPSRWRDELRVLQDTLPKAIEATTDLLQQAGATYETLDYYQQDLTLLLRALEATADDVAPVYGTSLLMAHLLEVEERLRRLARYHAASLVALDQALDAGPDGRDSNNYSS